MKHVHSAKQTTSSDIRHAGIAIRSIDSGQRHIGILHRGNHRNLVNLLDLAWHHRLRNGSPADPYYWIDPAVHSRRLRQVAAMCRKIWRSNGPDLPYAFSRPNDCFDEKTGRFLLGPTRLGLTCASFVLAVFHAVGLPLAAYDSWPRNRDGDKEWQERIVAALKQVPTATKEHIRAVQNEIGSARYRPEKVAAAAVVRPLPVHFQNFIEGSRQIRKLLDGV